MLCATTALPVGGTPAKSPPWVPVIVRAVGDQVGRTVQALSWARWLDSSR